MVNFVEQFCFKFVWQPWCCFFYFEIYVENIELGTAWLQKLKVDNFIIEDAVAWLRMMWKLQLTSACLVRREMIFNSILRQNIYAVDYYGDDWELKIYYK